MAAKAMPERERSDEERQGDHPVFEKNVVQDIDTQDGERGHQQRQNGAVDGAENRSSDA